MNYEQRSIPNSPFFGHDFAKNGVCTEWEGCNYLAQRGFAYQKMYRHNSLTKSDRNPWPLLWTNSPLLVGYAAQVELGEFVHAVAVKPNGVVLDPYREGEYRLSDYAKVNHLIAVFDIRESRIANFYTSTRDAEIARLKEETEQLRADIAKALRFDNGDRKRQYFIPAEPCPIGPLGIVEAAQKYMEMVDAADKRSESSNVKLREIVEELSYTLNTSNTALRHLAEGNYLKRYTAELTEIVAKNDATLRRAQELSKQEGNK